MIELERSIIEGFPKHIRYVARDGKGELWATAKEPKIVTRESGEKTFEFGADVTMDEMYSLAIYNHMFRYVERLSVIDLD